VVFASTFDGIVNKSLCVGPIFKMTFRCGWAVVFFMGVSFCAAKIGAPYNLSAVVAALVVAIMVGCQVRILSFTLLPSLQVVGSLRVVGMNWGTSIWFVTQICCSASVLFGDFTLSWIAGSDTEATSSVHTCVWMIPLLSMMYVLLTSAPEKMRETPDICNEVGNPKNIEPSMMYVLLTSAPERTFVEMWETPDICNEVGNPKNKLLAYTPRGKQLSEKVVLAATVHYICDVVGFSMVGTTTVAFTSAKAEDAVNAYRNGRKTLDALGKELIGHARSLRRRAIFKVVVELLCKRVLQFELQKMQLEQSPKNGMTFVISAVISLTSSVVTVFWVYDVLNLVRGVGTKWDEVATDLHAMLPLSSAGNDNQAAMEFEKKAMTRLMMAAAVIEVYFVRSMILDFPKIS